MLYQIFYDEKTKAFVEKIEGIITPCGVHRARETTRDPGFIYDDELPNNLTDFNTLCEWRVLYYVWQNLPSSWVGFTSWQHNQKGFTPAISELSVQRIETELSLRSLWPFKVIPLEHLMLPMSPSSPPTLRSQFTQWSLVEQFNGTQLNDTRSMPMGRYHHARYWEAILAAVKKRHEIDLDQVCNWEALGKIDSLHTWCHAFIATWEFFDAYMQFSAPIVDELVDQFGNHPSDLELSYSCERLLVIFNYLNEVSKKIP